MLSGSEPCIGAGRRPHVYPMAALCPFEDVPSCELEIDVRTVVEPHTNEITSSVRKVRDDGDGLARADG